MKIASAAAALGVALFSLSVGRAQAAQTAAATSSTALPGFEVAKSVKKKAAGKKPGKAKKSRAAAGRK